MIGYLIDRRFREPFLTGLTAKEGVSVGFFVFWWIVTSSRRNTGAYISSTSLHLGHPDLKKIEGGRFLLIVDFKQVSSHTVGRDIMISVDKINSTIWLRCDRRQLTKWHFDSKSQWTLDRKNVQSAMYGSLLSFHLSQPSKTFFVGLDELYLALESLCTFVTLYSHSTNQ